MSLWLTAHVQGATRPKYQFGLAPLFQARHPARPTPPAICETQTQPPCPAQSATKIQAQHQPWQLLRPALGLEACGVGQWMNRVLVGFAIDIYIKNIIIRQQFDLNIKNFKKWKILFRKQHQIKLDCLLTL
jgi:hypothetical protein